MRTIRDKEISNKEIIGFWIRTSGIKIKHGIIQSLSWPFWCLLFFLIDFLYEVIRYQTIEIDISLWAYLIMFFTQLFFLYGYILRYIFKWYHNPFEPWLNNETDFGDANWKEKRGLENNFGTAVRWNIRNMAWEALKEDKTPSHKDTYNLRTIKNTLNTGNKFTKANRDRKIYGVNHAYYRLNDGRTYGFYSKASPKKEIMAGVGNNRYLLRIKI